MKKALNIVRNGGSFRHAKFVTKVTKSTISRLWKELQDQEGQEQCFASTKTFVEERLSKCVVVLCEEEEMAVEEYCLWQTSKQLHNILTH